jgi:hypothetical protein
MESTRLLLVQRLNASQQPEMNQISSSTRSERAQTSAHQRDTNSLKETITPNLQLHCLQYLKDRFQEVWHEVYIHSFCMIESMTGVLTVLHNSFNLDIPLLILVQARATVQPVYLLDYLKKKVYLLGNQASFCAICSYLLDYINWQQKSSRKFIHAQPSNQLCNQFTSLISRPIQPYPQFADAGSRPPLPPTRHNASVEGDDILDATALLPSSHLAAARIRQGSRPTGCSSLSPTSPRQTEPTNTPAT